MLRLRRSKIRPVHWVSYAQPPDGNGEGGNNALTFNPDHLMGADQDQSDEKNRMRKFLPAWDTCQFRVLINSARIAPLAIMVTVMLSVTALSEVHAQAQAGGKRGLLGRAEQSSLRESNNPDFIPLSEVGAEARAGLLRIPAQAARDRGMIPTGLSPKFDEGVNCRGIDDGWAIDYTQKRGRDAMHGGIDIPAPRGMPIRAIAAGEVVAKALDDDGAQGIQIWLRHSPEDTGLLFWVYSQYTHLMEMPDFNIGHYVRMGDAIGKTGHTGISGSQARTGLTGSKNTRRDALHLAILYTDSRKYYRDENLLLPQDARWMDPNAIYRKMPPYDSVSMKALPAEQKGIPIPYMLDDGTIVPADSKLIWPYFCSR